MAASLQVATAQGRVEGVQRDRHQAFLGIPFAKAPTGLRRFGAPLAPDSWSGVRPAKAFGKSAIQGTSPIPGTAASGRRDEDCLYLNVYTSAADNAKRPVFFWIHGGGFTLGSGSEPLYDGKNLATRGDIESLGHLYAFGLLGAFTLSSLALDRVRIAEGRTDLTFALGLVATVGVSVAWLTSLFTRPTATVFGLSLTGAMLALSLLYRRGLPRFGRPRVSVSAERSS